MRVAELAVGVAVVLFHLAKSTHGYRSSVRGCGSWGRVVRAPLLYLKDTMWTVKVKPKRRTFFSSSRTGRPPPGKVIRRTVHSQVASECDIKRSHGDAIKDVIIRRWITRLHYTRLSDESQAPTCGNLLTHLTQTPQTHLRRKVIGR